MDDEGDARHFLPLQDRIHHLGWNRIEVEGDKLGGLDRFAVPGSALDLASDIPPGGTFEGLLLLEAGVEETGKFLWGNKRLLEPLYKFGPLNLVVVGYGEVLRLTDRYRHPHRR